MKDAKMKQALIMLALSVVVIFCMGKMIQAAKHGWHHPMELVLKNSINTFKK